MAIGTGTAILGAAALGAGGAYLQSQSNKQAAQTQAQGAKQAAQSQAQAAEQASQAQLQAAREAQQFQREMFESGQQQMRPFIRAGQDAVGQLSGLTDPAMQAQMFDQIAQGPVFAQQAEQAEQAMLRNASATGGLRTGQANVALGQVAPQIQQGLYQQQVGQLQGLAGMGMGAAQSAAGFGQQAGSGMANVAMQSGMGQGNISMQTGANQAAAAQQAAMAQAQMQQAQGQIGSDLLGDLGGLGMFAAMQPTRRQDSGFRFYQHGGPSF